MSKKITLDILETFLYQFEDALASEWEQSDEYGKIKQDIKEVEQAIKWVKKQ